MWRGRPRPRKFDQAMLREFLATIFVLSLWIGFYVCVRTFFSFIRRSALREEPRQNGLALEFFPNTAMNFLVRLTLILLAGFTAFIFVYALRRKEVEGLYAPLIPLAVFVSILLATPVSVVVDRDGIRQRRWFRSDKQIAWDDVALVELGPKTGTAYVWSKNGGPKIRFSSSLVGLTRFLREVRGHARDADIYSEEEET
jgi:hypothetical protein